MYNNQNQNYFNSVPFAFNDPINNSSYANANLSYNSVHLSPEELAAIDHGLMSVYGNHRSNNPPSKQSSNNLFNSSNQQTPMGNPKIFSNIVSNENNPINHNNNSNYFNTPTPSNNNNNPFFSATPYNEAHNHRNTPIFTNQQPANFAQTPQNYANLNSNTPPDTTPRDSDLAKSYEQRIDEILRQERNKFQQMESNYRNQLDDLKRSEFGYSEKLKLEQIIQDLRAQIDSLERKLEQNSRFKDTDKLEALKLHYDRKIATLVGQFEQEKASALEIMKTRAKAEINLLIPRLKAQIQSSFEKTQSETISRIKSQASSYIHKLKQDFQMERQVLIEHLKRKQIDEIKQIQSQLQLKFEAKLIEEKRKLQEQHHQQQHRHSDYFRSNSKNNDFGSNSKPINSNWFNNNLNFEPSFLL